MLCMINAVPDSKDHPKVANGMSDLFVEVFGDAGKHARSAVGMESLTQSNLGRNRGHTGNQAVTAQSTSWIKTAPVVRPIGRVILASRFKDSAAPRSSCATGRLNN